MKNYNLIIALLFVSVAALAKTTREDAPYLTKTFSKTVDALKVRTSGGSIMVMGQSGEARVEVYIKSNNWNGGSADKEEIEDRLKNYELTIKQDGNTIVCEAKNKNENDWKMWNKKGLSISFKIWVPEKTTTNLRTSGGSISLSKLSGSQDFATSGGSLDLKELGGKINGQTSGGSMNIGNSNGNIDLSTSGGSITAKNCKGKLKLDTSGGSINLTDLSGTVWASTSGGSINADISTLGESLELHTSGGSINATVPMNKGIDLELRGDRVHSGTLNNFSGKTEKNYIKGKLNGGGVLVKMTTSGGTVNLND
jgi:Putative adhesin